MTARCPSDLALERHLQTPDGSPLAGHLATCRACTQRLETMRRQGEEFLRYVYPATVGAVEAAAATGPDLLRWRRWLLLVPALGGATALLLLLARPTAPPDDYLGVKGGGSLGLAVFVQDGAGVRPIRDGEAVAAGSALRFRVRTDRPCRLWVLSVDARGQVSRLFPSQGEGGATVERAAELPGGAVLDGQPGPERIVALCAPAPVPWAGAEAAVRAAFGVAGAAGVRQGATVDGLPAGTTQDSLLLEKRP
jgi:hypothetical protein